MVNDKMSVVLVKKESVGELNDRNELQENEIFGGDRNPLTFQSYYDLSLRCSYGFTYFPFDHQWCHISESDSTIRVNFHFRRKINYHIANTYLPTMSLLAIVQVTLFFGKAKQEMAVTLSLTVLLVMYTFYQSISDSVPKTAYLKLMDYWLIFCLLVPFILFLVQSYWYLNRESPVVKTPHKSRQKSRKFSQRELARMLIVGLTTIYELVYFIIAIFVYYYQKPEFS